MGNYIFTASTLLETVTTDAADESSRHDIGGNIVPMLVERGDAAFYDFAENIVPGASETDRGYWRDVGEIDAYYAAHMDLISPVPAFNLYNREWPIYSWHAPLPPAKFVVDGQPGRAEDSLVSAGVIVSGGVVRRSVLSPSVRVEAGAVIDGSILLEGFVSGGGSRAQRHPGQERGCRRGRQHWRRFRRRPQSMDGFERRHCCRRQEPHGRQLTIPGAGWSRDRRCLATA